MEKSRVAIVGAGMSGLAAIKECLAEGLEPVCFEARPEIGGGWAYQPDATQAVQSSVYAATMLNSCRETTAFTDFPMDPARYGDYFPHTQFLRYFQEYAEHFGLLKHIRLSTTVLECAPVGNGKWRVRVQATGKEPEELEFAAVMVATGHLSTPYMPDFKRREVFQGQFLHSHYYRRPGPFEGKKVAVIGFGSSGIDIACEVAPQADELHLVTRRGGWVIPRYVLGKPAEAWDNRAGQLWIPEKVNQWLLGKVLDFVEGKYPKELRPNHKLFEQNPTLRGDLLEKVRCGVIKVQRAEVEAFTQTGLLLSNGVNLDVDIIIAATGYDHFDVPFVPADAMRSADHPPATANLYKLMIPPDPRYQNLFFLGFIELFGPLPPAVEAQSRYAAAMLSGRVSRPGSTEMAASIKKMHSYQVKNYLRTPRHALTLQGIPYVDDILAPLYAVPTFPRLLSRVFTGNPIKGLQVLSAVWFGVPTSAMWRLCGHGAKPELARETVLRISGDNEKMSKAETALLERTKVVV